MKNKQGALNLKLGPDIEVIRKAAKKTGMSPSRLAKILLTDAAAKVNSGKLKISDTPQIMQS